MSLSFQTQKLIWQKLKLNQTQTHLVKLKIKLKHISHSFDQTQANSKSSYMTLTERIQILTNFKFSILGICINPKKWIDWVSKEIYWEDHISSK